MHGTTWDSAPEIAWWILEDRRELQPWWQVPLTEVWTLAAQHPVAYQSYQLYTAFMYKNFKHFGAIVKFISDPARNIKNNWYGKKSTGKLNEQLNGTKLALLWQLVASKDGSCADLGVWPLVWPLASDECLVAAAATCWERQIATLKTGYSCITYSDWIVV